MAQSVPSATQMVRIMIRRGCIAAGASQIVPGHTREVKESTRGVRTDDDVEFKGCRTVHGVKDPVPKYLRAPEQRGYALAQSETLERTARRWPRVGNMHVQVRLGAVAGIAHAADELSVLDPITHVHERASLLHWAYTLNRRGPC